MNAKDTSGSSAVSASAFAPAAPVGTASGAASSLSEQGGFADDDKLSALRRFAEECGISTEYEDQQGQKVLVGAETLQAILAAMGYEVESAADIAAATRSRIDDRWRRTLPPLVVAREGWTPWVHTHVPHGTNIWLTIELENGGEREMQQVDRFVEPREVDGELIGEATFQVPNDLPCGYHRIVARLSARPYEASTTTATLLVSPRRLHWPTHFGSGRAVGIQTQLYQVRSQASWGIGDFGDLADLCSWAASRLGADFMLINPLHAEAPMTPIEPSPYLPTSRRFLNPIYLRIEDIPEMARLATADFQKVRRLTKVARALNGADTIDRDAVWEAKREALQIIHAVGLDGARDRDFRRFRVAQNEKDRGLWRFATWCAIAQEYGNSWHEWPKALQDPHGEAVEAYARAHEDVVDFYAWLQWLTNRQLLAAHRAGCDTGMRMGVITDMAVGVAKDGADAWLNSAALAQGMTVGAPPDRYNQLGQDWGQPPWLPEALATEGMAPYRRIVQAALAHAAGVRIDHILGLFRTWWIPEGMKPSEGAYVRYDAEAMLGVLVLEASRLSRVVIGEDLGLVDPQARQMLADRGVYGTSILWFEQDGEQPKQPEDYRRMAMTAVTTHDLPPTLGYLNLEHVQVREDLGLLAEDAQQVRKQEQEVINRVYNAMLNQRMVPPGVALASNEMVVGLHAWLGRTPSRMLAVSLADLVGDHRAVNQPGTKDEYPNWRVPLAGPDRMPLTLDDIVERGTSIGERAKEIFASF